MSDSPALDPEFMAWLIDLSWHCDSPDGAYGLRCGWSNGNDRLDCKGCGTPHPQAEGMKSLALAAGFTVTEYDRIEPPPRWASLDNRVQAD